MQLSLLEKTATKFAEIAVPFSVKDPFTYAVPEKMEKSVEVGKRVLVPFRSRIIIGYVVNVKDERPRGMKNLKRILEILDHEPVLSPELISLAGWMGEYYCSSIGEAIATMLPVFLKKKKKVKLQKLPSEKPSKKIAEAVEHELTGEQKSAWHTIRALLNDNATGELLLHGVTSSGKTELYVRAIKESLSAGKSAICLVPEIALTEQVRNYFLSHFKQNLAVIHSKLTDRERYIAWREIKAGKKRVILGARSALFSPVPNLGLVIIDEEQESSYKQDNVPRYDSKETARKRCGIEGALLILGSATPSTETFYAAQSGRIPKLSLTKRIQETELPEVKVVDLSNEEIRGGRPRVISKYLEKEIKKSLANKEGVLLLMNRRGFSSFVSCAACKSVIQCKDCEVGLTFHNDRNVLLCHYCNWAIKLTDKCPKCGASELQYRGLGTEKIESEVARLFPAAKIARLDTDVARKRNMHEKVLTDFRERKTDILVGTQMIAKGFDFAHVRLVGVVLADVGLSLPDFRSSERTFQLLTQFAGRAGRREKRGLVIIQTYSPGHYSILCAKDHDYESFYGEEIKKREELVYPPFTHLVNLVVRSRDEEASKKAIMDIKECLKLNGAEKFALIGPAPMPIYKLRGYFRWHVLLKGKEVMEMNRACENGIRKAKLKSSVKSYIDVDPNTIL